MARVAHMLNSRFLTFSFLLGSIVNASSTLHLPVLTSALTACAEKHPTSKLEALGTKPEDAIEVGIELTNPPTTMDIAQTNKKNRKLPLGQSRIAEIEKQKSTRFQHSTSTRMLQTPITLLQLHAPFHNAKNTEYKPNYAPSTSYSPGS